jgi:hypothetical protein
MIFRHLMAIVLFILVATATIGIILFLKPDLFEKLVFGFPNVFALLGNKLFGG